jgi:hypothetical protein
MEILRVLDHHLADAHGDVHKEAPARTCLMYTRPVGHYGEHKERAAGRGAYSGDPGSIGAGLCRILHPDFREFFFHALG